MAKQVKPINTGKIDPHSFQKDLVEDVSQGIPPNSWTQARNAVPNTVRGDLGELSNEQSNKFCAAAPYTIIGFVHLEADRWVIWSTDNTNSEIGLFEEELCKYQTIVNDECLNLSTLNLIKGVAKENFDCTWQVYWDDGDNPSRTLNIDNVPWIQECTDEAGQLLPGPPGYEPQGCIDCVDTDRLDCDAIRLSPLVVNPCFTVNKGAAGGELPNGSYFVTGAYVRNAQRVTDYSIPSNVQGLFAHSNVAGSLDITVDRIDDDFDEFELVVVRVVNNQVTAKKIGIYSTRQKRITIDIIDDRYPTVDFSLVSLRNPIVDKSEAMYRNGDYMIRVGPTSKFDFNYQPLANQITTRWVAVEYDEYYYGKGGNNVGYLRDEVYSFFIRWVYNTGDKSFSYHIPGRQATLTERATTAGVDATPETSVGETPNVWKVRNTASVTSLSTSTLDDDGVVVAKGKMAFWESTEKYDDDTPQIWNASYHTWSNSGNPDHDLCGKQIRHHRFPSNIIYDAAGNVISTITNHYDENSNGATIRIMGVEFDNIQPPVDNDGNPLTNIVGYEILRGSRDGNKSIIAKGMLNNMRGFPILGGLGGGRVGLYPNYPYNPTQGLALNDQFHSLNLNGTPAQAAPYFASKEHFTFHSPETSFKDPFLSAKELAIYGEFQGLQEGKFEFPDRHPKHKLITNFAFFASFAVGVGYAVLARKGKFSTRYIEPRVMHTGQTQFGFFGGFTGGGTWFGAAPGVAGGQGGLPLPPTVAQAVISGNNALAESIALPFIQAGGLLGEAIIGTEAIRGSEHLAKEFNATLSGAYGLLGGYTERTQEGGTANQLGSVLNGVLTAISTGMDFGVLIGEGTDKFLRLLKALSPFRQHALQYQSHGFYDDYGITKPDNTRRVINDSIYLDPQIQDFGTQYRINNLNRARTVALETANAVDHTYGLDISQVKANNGSDPTKNPIVTPIASHYVGLKQRLRNQYGQIEGIVQIPVTTCNVDIENTNSGVLFGGDVYIGRYTEKNTMPFFTNWLFGQPDGEEFDYSLYSNIGFARYWANTVDFDFNDFISGLITNLTTLNFNFGNIIPSSRHRLDEFPSPLSPLTKRDDYFYLFHSGVRDFFVESEINVDYRDWGDNDTERHYDYKRFTNLPFIFNSAIITSGNFYKYDFSLSVAKLYNNLIPWGNVQARDYDPEVAETCFVSRPNRVLYSLPQNMENKKDFWRVFLPLNYRDFKSRVTAIKPVNKNGALILFENESPVEFKGVDTLETGSGNKITIGDGGLFSQPFQNVLNTDESYEYGSCQNRLSVINTASGIFWMSQNQGKIFQLANGVKEISAFDMKWWLSTYLPYKLTEDFPDFELQDNPVSGIGCQTIYDNERQMVYFCKKDYQVRTDIEDTVTYVDEDNFLVNNRLPVKLGDPRYFEDASWTISYDPKTESWIGYHDWHPDLLMPSKTNFYSTKGSDLWLHNDGCESYCNFYGVDYPFEVEYAVVTPQVVNTLRSVEYYMEVYKYDENCYDRFHVLDFNFDEAVIYNSEQNSGLLRLNLNPKNDAPGILNYPQINPNSIDILYSKEEHKYRFNQFWDITDDRGEFNPAAERAMWNTEANGYVRNLNPNNLNYNKFQTERKKFRHYKNTVLLRRRVSGNRNMIVSIANNKNLQSFR